jgi:uncharacterized membrane protein YkvA (DUF1232 family)
LKHPRAPRSVRFIAGCAVAYIFSPVQLIPTFIPVIGQLDDLLVLFLGMKLVRKWTPAGILAECEARSGLLVSIQCVENHAEDRIKPGRVFGADSRNGISAA